jgi:hypothetical protein
MSDPPTVGEQVDATRLGDPAVPLNQLLGC